MNAPIKPRVIIHNSTAPFVETYIDMVNLRSGILKDRPETDEELFHMIARAVVAPGVLYWEVDWEAINAAYDPATRDAWVIDPDALGSPSGYGDTTYV